MKIKILGSFARQAFHNTAVYRFDFWLRIVNNFVWMFSSYWLWIALYHQDVLVFNVSLKQMLTYAILSSVLGISIRPGGRVAYQISTKVKSGEIVMDMLKPLDFQFHMLARNMGETLFFSATLGIPSFIVGYFFLGMQPPSSLLVGLAFLLSLILGYGIMFSLNYLLGLIAVFTIDIRNISWAYDAIVNFLSGSYVPLWLFPGFLYKLADALPFKCILYIPLSIYISKLELTEITKGIGIQFVWLIILVMLGRCIWHRANKHIIVQGG